MGCEVKAPSAPTVTKGPWLLALWPPTKQKLRLSSQEISSWSCCSPWMKKMDWARQTRHELKAFTEQLALILLLQVARQRSRFPPPPPTIAQWHTKESRIASTWWLLKPQTVWVNVIWRLIGQPYYPCLLFLPCHETPWWLPAQTGKNTSSSIIREHITKHIVQLTDHLLLVDMSRTVASSLIISRSFQTKPFFQKVNLTPGLRYEVITMDDGQLKIPLKWKSTVVSFWPLCLTF